VINLRPFLRILKLLFGVLLSTANTNAFNLELRIHF